MKHKIKYKITYKWKRTPKGAPNAGIAGRYLSRIKRTKGGLTPKSLVREATKTESPLHGCFEWDNTKAAKEYRLVQAREILRFIVIESEETDDTNEVVHVRAFVSPQELEQESGTSYVGILQVRNDEELHAAYLRQLKQELDEIKAKIKHYKEFVAVVREIEKVKI